MTRSSASKLTRNLWRQTPERALANGEPHALVLHSWDTRRGTAPSKRLRLNVSSHATMQAT